MKRADLCEVVIPTDRWSIRAVSPLDISEGVDGTRHPVLVHPGWGKDPERHLALMADMADAGFLPIGVDTRYGYCDQQITKSDSRIPRLLRQRYTAGTTNPYFDDAGRTSNRWGLRRPTALLYLCEQLGVKERTFVGHSEGGRIVSLAALASLPLTRQVVVVNGAGSGDSSDGYSRLLRSNTKRTRDLMAQPKDIPVALRSALGSIAYTVTHLRRTLKEKQVIQSADLWQSIDQLGENGVPVTVFHATGDELISFEDSEARALQRPWVNFHATEGDHSNVYEVSVRQLIVNSLL